MTNRSRVIALALASFVGLVIQFSLMVLVATIATDLDSSVLAIGQALTA